MSFDILNAMFRRFLALTLTAVILGAPIATAVCQATCPASEAAAAENHSCHGDAAPEGVALSAPAHACGHTDQLPPGRDQAREELAPPLAIMAAATVIVSLGDVARPAPLRRQYSPPLFVTLAAPLRL